MKIKTFLKNLFVKGISLSAIIALLSACGPKPGEEIDNTIDPNDPNKPGPVDPGKPTVTVDDIYFQPVGPGSGNGFVTTTNSQLSDAFYRQSATIRDQYSGNSHGATPEFANTVRMAQGNIDTACTFNQSIAEISRQVTTQTSSIANAMGGLFTDTNDTTLFNAQIAVFRQASYMNQRRHLMAGDDGSGMRNRLTQLIEAMKDAGGNVTIPQGATPAQIVAILRESLITMAPETAGTGRANLIQQIGNGRQLSAWVDDLSELGLTTSTTHSRNATAPGMSYNYDTNTIMMGGRARVPDTEKC